MTADNLVTGAAGFIGAALCSALLDRGETVVGVDNLSSYYDVGLKEARLARLVGRPGFTFVRLDISEPTSLLDLVSEVRPARFTNLAAQVGVRHSLRAPSDYVQANLVGFGNVLESCRQWPVKHLVFASSSSVYGSNGKVPFSEHDSVDHPISLYAATKKANELMAHSYSHLFGLPCTGLRFFTVYGPWGRPDMAPLIFTKAILEGRPIDVFNGGKMRRDFTYVDDVVDAIVRALDRPPQPSSDGSSRSSDPASSSAPYRIFNVGSSAPVELLEFVRLLGARLGREVRLNPQPLQPGDLVCTFAETANAERDLGFRPRTPIDVGLARMVDWYLGFEPERVSPVSE